MSDTPIKDRLKASVEKLHALLASDHSATGVFSRHALINNHWKDVVDLWNESGASERAVTGQEDATGGASMILKYEDVMVGLHNVGIDTTCGACMEVFFTGMTMAPHDGDKCVNKPRW